MSTFCCRTFTLACILFVSVSSAVGQSDAQFFAEGRVAMDQYKDCPAAESALLRVTDSFRSNPGWIMYMGRTEECLKKYQQALDLYRRYDSLIPGNTDILNKIGSLSYLVDKANQMDFQNELVGTWVGYWLKPNSKSIGRITRIDISLQNGSYTGTVRNAAFSYCSTDSDDNCVVYKRGAVTIQRDGGALSVKWGPTMEWDDYGDSSPIYPQDSTGTFSKGSMILRFQWGPDSWDSVVLNKSDSAEGISNVKQALQSLDNFISDEQQNASMNAKQSDFDASMDFKDSAQKSETEKKLSNHQRAMFQSAMQYRTNQWAPLLK